MLTVKHTRLLKLVFSSVIVLLLINLTAKAQSGIRTNILNIADKLQKDNQVHFGYPVGFAGKPETSNKYFKLYKKLKVKATDQELVELIKSKSALVVVYAFDILQERNYAGLTNVFLEHANDTTWFWTASGCTGFVDRVNWFMLRRLKPTEGNTTSLAKVDYDMYCSRFKKEDQLFTCN
ncbi:MAG: hypothetical protein EOO10_20030 [Chitinophagaceae bacterium]|nr:MAG: hypothetical protein EOO10_20030 [Chitinophagaceae bacterium]